MGLHSVTRLAKHSMIRHLQRSAHSLQSHSSYAFPRSYLIVIKPRFPQKTQSFSHSFLRKSMYSSSASPNEKRGFIGWYLRMLESRPILTKAVSSSLIYAAADFTSQMITMNPSGHIDLMRTTRMASFGLLILGPSQHVWFNFVGNVLPKRDVVSTLKKIMMGQLIFGPIINSIFFSFNAGLQGETGHQIVARLKRDLLPTLLSGVMYWPLCDFIMFKAIPVRLQPLINSSFAYLWSIYLTYMASLGKAD